MPINPFKLERYFALYEFKVKYLLSSSDCESLSLEELLQMASPASLKLWQNLSLGYTESQGLPLLREEAAGLYQHIDSGHILITAPEEGIFIAMNSLLKTGDHVICMSPVYQSLYELANAIGCEVTPWQIKTGENGWQLDLNELKAGIKSNTRMLVINFPHNPTGYLPSQDDYRHIIELARWHELTVFSDEMYRCLESEPELRLPSACDLYEKAVTLSGLSKSFSLPGLRMGWLATQDGGSMEKFINLKDYTTICSSAPSEILAVIALQNKERIVHSNLEIVHRNVSIADEFFKRHAGLFTWFKPKAGSIAFPCWLGRELLEEFCQKILEQRGVMIVPGCLFDYPGSHFRIGLGRKNFAEALGQVDDYLSNTN